MLLGSVDNDDYDYSGGKDKYSDPEVLNAKSKKPSMLKQFSPFHKRVYKVEHNDTADNPADLTGLDESVSNYDYSGGKDKYSDPEVLNAKSKIDHHKFQSSLSITNKLMLSFGLMKVKKV